MYRSDQLGDDTEKQKRADPPMNAFFIDASALRFFGCVTEGLQRWSFAGLLVVYRRGKSRILQDVKPSDSSS